MYLSKEKIYLGDIAGFSGVSGKIKKDLELIYLKSAAVPGKSTVVRKRSVEGLVKRRYKYVKVKGAEKIRVHTEKGLVNRKEVEDTARKYLLENMPWKKNEAEIYIREREKAISVLKGDVHLKVKEDNKIDFRGNEIVPVEIYVNSRFYRIEPVSAVITVKTGCLIASSDIKRGEVVPAGAVSVAEKDITRMPGGVITDPSFLRNRITKRGIMKGTVLLKSMFKRVPLFKRKDKITVIARIKGIIVEAPGTALSEGREGDVVKAELVTGKVVEGKVDKMGRIIIE